MTDTQPEALRLADELETEFAQGRISNHTGRKAATELRRLHAENETLRARSLPEIKDMHNGPQQLNLSDRAMWVLGWNECRDAARDADRAMRAAQHAGVMLGEQAELRRLSDCCPELNLSNYGPDDVDELNGWAIEVSQCIDRALAAQPAGAQQPDTAYAELPSYEHQRAIMEAERNASLDEYSRIVPLTSTESMIYERAFTNGWNRHASHGQAPAPAPAQAAPAAVAPNWTDAANWLRNNYQDYPNIASLCEGMIAASPLATSTGTPPINWENAMPGGKYTDKWESSRVADYNRGWNDYRKESHKKLKELTAATTARAAPQQEAQEPVMWAMWRESTGWLAESCEKTRDECIANCIEAAVSEGLPPDFAATRGWIPRSLHASPTSQGDALAVVDVPDQCPYSGPSSHRNVWLAGWYAARKQARRKP